MQRLCFKKIINNTVWKLSRRTISTEFIHRLQFNDTGSHTIAAFVSRVVNLGTYYARSTQCWNESNDEHGGSFNLMRYVYTAYDEKVSPHSCNVHL